MLICHVPAPYACHRSGATTTTWRLHYGCTLRPNRLGNATAHQKNPRRRAAPSWQARTRGLHPAAGMAVLPSDRPSTWPLQQVAHAMVELDGWFKKEFWNGAGADGRINTKLITKKLESYLSADPDGVRLEVICCAVGTSRLAIRWRGSRCFTARTGRHCMASTRTRSTPLMMATGRYQRSRAAAPSRITAS